MDRRRLCCCCHFRILRLPPACIFRAIPHLLKAARECDTAQLFDMVFMESLSLYLEASLACLRLRGIATLRSSPNMASKNMPSTFAGIDLMELKRHRPLVVTSNIAYAQPIRVALSVELRRCVIEFPFAREVSSCLKGRCSPSPKPVGMPPTAGLGLQTDLLH